MSKILFALITLVALISTGSAYNYMVSGVISKSLEDIGVSNAKVFQSPDSEGYMIALPTSDILIVCYAIGALSAAMVADPTADTSFIGYPSSEGYITAVIVTPGDAKVIYGMLENNNSNGVMSYVMSLPTQDIAV